MKLLIINLFVVFSLFFATTSCKKENSSNNSSSKKEGDISVSINYNPSTNSTFVHSWGQTEIRLHKDGALVSTKYANPNNANIDFGKQEYGNYRVDCVGAMQSINVNTGSSSNKTITRSENFVLESDNKNVNITMSY